jgi:signal transduction histidine kinase
MSTFHEPAATSAFLTMTSPGIARKTQRVVGIALIALLTVLFLPLQAIIFFEFSELEQRTVSSNVERAINEINDDRQRLLQLTRDYAAWDDAYAFAQGKDASFITQNFNQSSFESNQLNLVIILNATGKVLAYNTFQIDAARGGAADDELLQRVLGSSLLSQIGPDHGATGMILLPGEPLVLSAHPILKSTYSGPSMGTMIMGHTLDAARVVQFGTQLQMDLRLHRLDQPDLPDTISAIAKHVLKTGEPLVTPLNMDSVAGYGLITNVAGEPMLLVQVSSAREIMKIGRTTAIYTLIAFIAAGMIATFTLTLLLNQLVLERLGRLIAGVQEIGVNKDLRRRVALGGNDEFSLLSNTIDETMHALEQAEDERRDAEAKRQQMWEDVIASRRNFLATVSHELRTPLTPIRGYADLMLHGIGGALTTEQQHFLQVIHQNSRRMEAMVNDLLVMGQLDVGRIELRVERMEIAAAIQSVLTMLEQQIQQQQIAISIDIPANLPQVRADAHRLDQILANLITNAVKYTRAGGRVQIQAHHVGEDQVEVAVHDTGIGMSASEMERLFTPFYRADSVLSQQISGTGLGLSITRSLVELHGGTISVESAPGAGSVFRFTLPIFAATHTAAVMAQASTEAL